MSEKPAINVDFPNQITAVVTLARPEAANALNTRMALEIKGFFENLASNIRVVVLTGEGSRAFCAGADLKERKGMSVAQWETQHQAFRMALAGIVQCQVPVIAAVNGAAFGGGLELALACDFIYAAENANFALPEATLGIMPGLGGTQSLPRAVGIRRAKELLFTGATFSAREAHGWGMINALLPQEKLLPHVLAVAERIAKNAPLSVISVKRAAEQGIALSVEEGMHIESSLYNRLVETKDRHEGIDAFNEKRPPRFTGE